MVSLETDELKACPACGQALKLHYRFCIRCGMEYPVPSVSQEPAPDEDLAALDNGPVAVVQSPPPPEPALIPE